MAKAAKSTRKFAASGQLKKTIQNRKKHQQILKKAAGRRGAGKDAKGKGKKVFGKGDREGEHDEDEKVVPVKKGKGCVFSALMN
jgi:nucleolar complex protein 2